MTMRFVIKVLLQFRCIDEISVVSQADPVWTVDIEGLRFGIGAASSCRIPQVADSHGTRKVCQPGTVMEDPGSHAIAFALVYTATGSTC